MTAAPTPPIIGRADAYVRPAKPALVTVATVGVAVDPVAVGPSAVDPVAVDPVAADSVAVDPVAAVVSAGAVGTVVTPEHTLFASSANTATAVGLEPQALVPHL